MARDQPPLCASFPELSSACLLWSGDEDYLVHPGGSTFSRATSPALFLLYFGTWGNGFAVPFTSSSRETSDLYKHHWV